MSEPTTTDDVAIDAVRDAFIAQFAEEPGEEVAEVEGAGEAVEAVAEAVEQTDAPADEPAEAAVESSEPTEPESRGYRRLLAREAKFREEKQALDAERKAIEADKAAVAEFKRTQAKLRTDPVAFLRAAGMSQKEILETLSEVHKLDLGDLAPPEVRADLAARRAERIAREAEERLAEQSAAAAKAVQEREAQHFIQQYQAGIETFVASELAEYPQLAAVAAAGKPVAQAIYQTAVEMAQANPTGPAPTYKQVADHLNQQLADLMSAVSAPAPTAPATAPAAPTASGKPVLRNSTTQTQPGPAPERKDLSYDDYAKELRQKVLQRHGLAR